MQKTKENCKTKLRSVEKGRIICNADGGKLIPLC